jgi:hypothetical protein
MKTVSFALALLLVWPASSPGQTTFSLAGGLNVRTTVPTLLPSYHGSTSQGFALQASLGRSYNARFGWRIDAFVNQFELTQPSNFAGVMCQSNPPPGTCCGICPGETLHGRVGMMGVAVNQLVRVTPAAFPVGMYLIWGAETDLLYDHPAARGALRFGASAGGGLTLPLAGHVHGFIEARYHHLVDAIAPTGLVPVTVGLRM